MAVDDIQKLIFEVSDLKRRLGQMVRVGSVKEVKSGSGEQKLRMNLGKDGQGEDILSPWLHTSDHRGGAREEARYKEGQNVMLISPNGDWRQAQIFPYAENKKNKRPDHASDDSETYQFEQLRMTKKKDHYEVWLAEEDKQGEGGEGESEGGGGSGGGEGESESGGEQKQAKPKMKLRVHKDGGITGRIGDKARFQAHEKGVKIKMGGNTIFVDDAGCWTTKPIEVKADPIPDDND